MASSLDLLQLLAYRADATSRIREVFGSRGALEVSTPVLSTMPDLAPVPQFVTSNPKTGLSHCLRIAPEEHLTRLIASGVEAVFEIATNFRCEVLDETHLIEFESVEAMFAGASLDGTLELMEQSCRAVSEAGAGATGTVHWQLPSEPFPRVCLPEFLEEEFGACAHDLFDAARLSELSRVLKRSHSGDASMSTLIDEVIGGVAKQVGGAVFIGIFPHYLGGPAERDAAWPDFITRYELYFDGLELGSVASQLRDIDEWRRRYVVNGQLKTEIGISPNMVNKELLVDLELLPEYVGLGFGLDRMLALGAGIADVRDTRLFLN